MITIINYSERYKADFIRLNTEWIENKDSYKLAKMAVSPNAQGHHIGYQLGTALIDYARKIGAKRLYLEGNTKLEASIHLYQKLGFKEVPLEGNSYDRCNIIMQLTL